MQIQNTYQKSIGKWEIKITPANSLKDTVQGQFAARYTKCCQNWLVRGELAGQVGSV